MTEAEKMAAAMAAAMGVKLVENDGADGTQKTDEEIIAAQAAADKAAAEAAQAAQGSSSGGGQNDGGSGTGAGTTGGGQSIPEGKKLPDSGSVVSDFDKLIADKSKGKFKSFDDIEKALQTLPADSFANDEVAKINEYVKGGGNLDDFIRTQRTDYSKKPDVDVLRDAERIADPTLSEDDITLLLEDKYGVTGNATDKEKRLKEIQLKRDAAIARQQLIDHQKQWAVPTKQGKTAEEASADAQKWVSSLSTTAEKVEKIEIKLNDVDTFEYSVPKETRSKVSKENENLATFFKRYLNEDGSENVAKFVKDMVILSNFEDIVKTAAGFNKAKGREEIVKGIKQTDFKPIIPGSTGAASAKTIAQQAAEQIFRK